MPCPRIASHRFTLPATRPTKNTSWTHTTPPSSSRCGNFTNEQSLAAAQRRLSLSGTITFPPSTKYMQKQRRPNATCTRTLENSRRPQNDCALDVSRRTSARNGGSRDAAPHTQRRHASNFRRRPRNERRCGILQRTQQQAHLLRTARDLKPSKLVSRSWGHLRRFLGSARCGGNKRL